MMHPTQTEFQVGSSVRARGIRFMVLAADLVPQPNRSVVHRLRLRALEDPFRNQEIILLSPPETVQPDEIPELDLSRPGRLARFQLLMDAMRLGLSPGEDQLVSSRRARIQFEPYQQVPALRALALPRPRLLIADDVGLGKTIEAGLILRELNARRRASRVLIVSPASILEQWQTELASKFGFQFKIFDSEGVAEARRAYEVGTNPWCAEPRVIASIDYIKRREGAFRELSASRWDVIIIDEAHHLASGGGDEDLTDRYRLARWLAAENTGALILLTATPHDGYDENFASLLSLLEPSLVIPGRELRFDTYKQHIVRRLKRHIRLPDGRPKFVEREPVRPIPVRLTPAETRVQEAVRAEASSLYELAEKALRTDREPIRMVATVLRKRAASSLAALRKTILQRKENLRDSVADVEIRREYLRAVKRGEPIPEEAQARLERDLYRTYQAAMMRAGRELRLLEEEQRRLERLEALVDECGGGPESKLRELEQYLKSLHGKDGSRKVIVFSEYADTVDAIVEHLEQAGYSGKVVKLTGEVSGRKDRRAILERFASSGTQVLVATDIAGEGLNLHEHCHHLVHFELPWNPNRLEQRNGRIDRYGQTKPPVIAYLYAAGSYEDEVLNRLVQKIEAQLKRLGSVGDVLGQIQADHIEELLRRPASDLRRAIAEAEAELNNELNRAADPRIRQQVGEGGDVEEELERTEAAIRNERERGVALDVFLERAVRAAGGAVHRTGTALRVTTPNSWLSADVLPTYEKLLPPGSYEAGEELAPDEVLHEDHPLIQAALRWVRASRFRADDDHRLACVAVPDLEEPELIATFLATLQDGTGAQVQRLEAVRVTRQLTVSRDAAADDAVARESHPGNVPAALLDRLFRDWWLEARRLAENEARRRATDWKESLMAFRGLERESRKAEIDCWDKASIRAILGDYQREFEQARLFGGQPALPPSIRRRLEDHRKRAEFQRALLERRMSFGEPMIEPLGVLLRVPARLIQEAR